MLASILATFMDTGVLAKFSKLYQCGFKSPATKIVQQYHLQQFNFMISIVCIPYYEECEIACARHAVTL